VAETSVENVPSQKLFLKLGFRKEGVLRKHHFLNGKLLDNIVFGLLREEWKGRTLK
jgi:ribosomal-protein-serine acetyltransferase